ncbi:MAG: response regulator [Acidobacteria bacterium]|nr:response regulator [Acidobacteriota bacterium]
MLVPLSSVSLNYDYDLVAARRRARQIAALLGFDEGEQTRIATVASEIARNALRYGKGGRFEFGIDRRDRNDMLVMTVSDRGPGISNLDDILAGRYQSTTGMGLGILGARRLMDEFSITSSEGKGTVVVMRKQLPPGAAPVTNARIGALADDLARQKPENPIEEIQQQNGELLAALATLNDRQEELERLNQELEDTNRGVLALYAELDEKAEHLRQADQLKTRFLSDMSHEFRTPVNSIIALARLLSEASLADEEAKQIFLIRRAAEDLATLVGDLLDLAKIEAGKVDVRTAEIEVPNLFSALRGMLRPLLANRSLSLVFEEGDGLPTMYTDEAKLAQILRNFISNALKYTERGEVRISAALQGEVIVFTVADTGIGIAPDDQERIFEEFTQVDHPLQERQKGTGLGLPLTRKLAALLGGRVGVRSEVGVGSAFWAEIPVRYQGVTAARASSQTAPDQPITGAAERTLRVLVIDDDETARYTVTSFAVRPGVEVSEAESGLQGIMKAQAERPDLILLDLMMPGVGGHEVLQRLRSDPNTASIPVVVITSRFVNEEEKREILSKASAVVYKGDLSRDVVTRAIDEALSVGE